MTHLLLFLLQATPEKTPDITIGELLRQGGLVAVCGILIFICLKLLSLYLKKDKALREAMEAAQAREDKERQRIEDKYEAILKERDESLRASTAKFEQLSEKFREQIRTIAVDQQKFSDELTTVLEKMADDMRDELRTINGTLSGMKRS